MEVRLRGGVRHAHVHTCTARVRAHTRTNALVLAYMCPLGRGAVPKEVDAAKLTVVKWIKMFG